MIIACELPRDTLVKGVIRSQPSTACVTEVHNFTTLALHYLRNPLYA